jgi:signal transduction histidine kinase
MRLEQGYAADARTRSLASRLAQVAIVLGTPLLIIFSVAFYLWVRDMLYDELDAGLAGRARALASTVGREHDAWDFEYAPGIVTEYEPGPHAAYFQIVLPGGSEIGRSVSLGSSQLPIEEAGDMDAPHFQDLTLPDGRSGRMATIRFIARLEEDIRPEEVEKFRFEVWLAVAAETRQLDAALAELRVGLLLMSGLAILAFAGLSMVAVRIGLVPLQRVASRIEAIDARDLSVRIDPNTVPAELAVAVEKLDDLLARLEESFTRERRFTADVSHELRTPLAALSAILEVVSSRQRSPSEYEDAIAESRRVVSQLITTAERLLWLSRADARQLEVQREPVDLTRFINECWSVHARDAEKRRLSFESRLPEHAVIETDRKMLELVLSNLLSNAVAYTEEGGWIRVEGGNGAALIDVVDSGPPIPEEHLPHLFERFWRSDKARSGDGAHAGIGLSLAASLSSLLELKIVAENLPEGAVRFRLRDQPSSASRSSTRSSGSIP